MHQTSINHAELILNQHGRIYHLDAAPEDIAQTIFLVGDPDRVPLVSQHFDKIETIRQHREFITHTGYIGNMRLSVISTGISTANIDIVLNEIDALVNIDLTTRMPKETTTALNFIRIGTAGGLQKDIEIDSFVASTTAISLDNLLHYYPKSSTADEEALLQAFTQATGCNQHYIYPTISSANHHLAELFKPECHLGITATSPGFYAPQGRRLRAQPVFPEFINMLANFEFNQQRILNLEMETGAIYGFGKLFGHHCLSLSAIIANRALGTFSTKAQDTVNRLIEYAVKTVYENDVAETLKQKQAVDAIINSCEIELA